MKWLDDAPVGALPCEDLERITPIRVTETAKIYDWKGLTPALQKGVQDSHRPPVSDPPDVSFALSYFQMCTDQKLGRTEIPRLPTVTGSPVSTTPIMDPASIPREMSFSKRAPAGEKPRVPASGVTPGVPARGPVILWMP